MKQDKWSALTEARRLLKLPEEVTRLEILAAYRERCREHHPDIHGNKQDEYMLRLNASYKLLIDYADHYKLKLSHNEDGMTGEEWWMHHFGQDPIWIGDKKDI